MKILVLAEDYPSKDSISSMFIHIRDLYYAKNDVNVTVLNFRAISDYEYDNIKVITTNTYRNESIRYDLLVLHAANIRHHYVFLKRYGRHFEKILFFYHGHEVLKINKVYPKPYTYIRRNKLKFIFQDVYDDIKLFIWRHYLPKINYKSYYVFVSNWMRNEFLKWTKISENLIEGKYAIIYNCVGKEFEIGQYDATKEKKYDFITIRGNIDGSKYSIDIVNRLALSTPECKFLLVGKGDYFNYNEKATNIEWRNQTMHPDEIIEALQSARFALMPTRTDAQGLMMCEMAAFGIPIITSDLPVCHEVFDGFNNAFFIKNEKTRSLIDFINRESRSIKDIRFYMNNTIDKELELIYGLTVQ